jgi:hypothetical protein
MLEDCWVLNWRAEGDTLVFEIEASLWPVILTMRRLHPVNGHATNRQNSSFLELRKFPACGPLMRFAEPKTQMGHWTSETSIHLLRYLTASTSLEISAMYLLQQKLFDFSWVHEPNHSLQPTGYAGG